MFYEVIPWVVEHNDNWLFENKLLEIFPRKRSGECRCKVHADPVNGLHLSIQWPVIFFVARACSTREIALDESRFLRNWLLHGIMVSYTFIKTNRRCMKSFRTETRLCEFKFIFNWCHSMLVDIIICGS